MAEAIGVVASIIAVIQLADKVTSVCQYYIEASRDTPKDVTTILVETALVKAVLETVNFLVNTGNAELLNKLQEPGGTIDACSNCMSSLHKLFPEIQKPQGQGKRQKISAALAWPLRKAKADALLQDLARAKSSLMLAIAGDTARDVKEIKQAVNDARDSLKSADRDRILDWLVHTNPTRSHTDASDLREEHTGTWMLRSSQWQQWLNSPSAKRLLWIHGIPGAGKTILLSFLVQALEKWSTEHGDEEHPVIYYYCHFTHFQDETAPLLRWVLTQLCRKAKYVPPTIARLYEQRRETSKSQLTEVLSEVVVHFRVITIAIDALDESDPRSDLLSLLQDLATRPEFSNIRIVATSREYRDIERALSNNALSVPMANELVQQDIKTFVESAIQSDPNFSEWPSELLDETTDALAKGAKGMFRWAVCQLDILRRLYSANDVRLALRSLPETLDETYERIFLSIRPTHTEFAKNILITICAHDKVSGHSGFEAKLTAATLVSLVTSEQSQFLSPEGLLKNVCGCLITIRKDEQVSLAHYTVREYLFSKRIQASKVRHFDLSGCDSMSATALRTLGTLAEFCCSGSDSIGISADDLHNYSDLFSAWVLAKFPDVVCNSEELYKLAYYLFNMCPTRCFRSRSLYCPTLEWVRSGTPADLLVLFNMAVFLRGDSVLLDRVIRGMEERPKLETHVSCRLETAKGVVDMSILDIVYRIPRHSDVWEPCPFVGLVQFLFELDGDTVLYRLLRGSALDWVGLWDKYPWTIEKPPGQWLIELLSATKVDVNPCGYIKTPLQVAVEDANALAVSVLLSLGAASVATGQADGMIVDGVTSDRADVPPLELCRQLMTSLDVEVSGEIRKAADSLEKFQEIEGLLLDPPPHFEFRD